MFKRALIAQHCDVWFAEYKPGFRNFEANIARMAADLRAMDALAATYGRRLRYAINPLIGVQAGYHYTDINSDLVAREYSRNRVYAGVSLTF